MNEERKNKMGNRGMKKRPCGSEIRDFSARCLRHLAVCPPSKLGANAAGAFYIPYNPTVELPVSERSASPFPLLR